MKVKKVSDTLTDIWQVEYKNGSILLCEDGSGELLIGFGCNFITYITSSKDGTEIVRKVK